ncbi:MAG: prepilin-type N-terminal cleavage/methylation domain-containing protein [Sedimentisphaerales bacterium]|nr:prepilin-type N-terminal cleavage/methylation domain-containing protein [Sedimentisphaerales bacterium]
MRRKSNGFTIIELMVVILIIGILAAIAAPLMQARVDKSKWSEACTSAGTIRTAVRNYASEVNSATVQTLAGKNLGDITIQQVLNFSPQDLEGTFFSPGDYTITSINSDGIAAITVEGGSKDDSPSGSYTLQTDGKWIKQ